ncbi:MAG: hypothetical protein O3A10_08920 [Chloroflexi bacterium]|nr:hypothetical protein [Chloroflexota bacterium]MDA1147439.1 hypothetical protein [Chloroflexota bacterium]
MQRHSIENALGKLRPGEAQLAAAALDWIVGDDPQTEVTQGRLQEFLWFALPAQVDSPDAAELLRATARALAHVFEEAGLQRYAMICGSTVTRSVHDAYLRDAAEGQDAGDAAAEASGLSPPDVDGFSWGDPMGPVEFEGMSAAESALEAAIVSGDLVPGRRGWQGVQRQIVTATLDEAIVAVDGPSRRTQIGRERSDAWQNTTGGLLGRLRHGASIELDGELDRSVLPEATLEPLTWFLRAIGDGVPLTKQGNLAVAFVRKATAERGWYQWGNPRSEIDVIELSLLHDFTKTLRAARHRSGRIVLTKRGLAMAAGGRAAFHPVVDWVAAGDGAEELIFEVLVIRLLEASISETTLAEEDLHRDIAVVLAECGYRLSERNDISPDEAALLVMPARQLMETLGLCVQRGPWDARVLELTEPGVVTSRAILMARASGPAAMQVHVLEVPGSRPPSSPSALGAVPDRVLELRLSLRDIEPPIWRRLLVQSRSTIADLHYLIQGAIGWYDVHLHMFECADGRVFVANPDPDFEFVGSQPVLDGKGVQLREILVSPADRLVYSYDFGDGWEHDVVLEAIHPAAEEDNVPRVTDGARAHPPEGCGGPWGYRDLLEALGDPAHERHNFLVDQLDGYEAVGFDPERFSLEETNATLDIRQNAD